MKKAVGSGQTWTVAEDVRRDDCSSLADLAALGQAALIKIDEGPPFHRSRTPRTFLHDLIQYLPGRPIQHRSSSIATLCEH